MRLSDRCSTALHAEHLSSLFRQRHGEESTAAKQVENARCRTCRANNLRRETFQQEAIRLEERIRMKVEHTCTHLDACRACSYCCSPECRENRWARNGVDLTDIAHVGLCQ